MKRKLIEDLLGKYFNAESTLEEEEQLQNYFNSDQVDVDLLSYKSYFSFIQTEKTKQVSAGFDEKLFEKLEQTPIKAKSRNLWPVLSRIAAVVVLAIGVYFLIPKEPSAEPTAIDWSKYEVQSVEEALLITHGSLLKTSTELNNASTHSMNKVQKVKALSSASVLSAKEVRKMGTLTKIFK